MQKPTPISILGIILALIIISLGISALTTPNWLIVHDKRFPENVYSLFERCERYSYNSSRNDCERLNGFSLSQILSITGVAVIAVGNILAISLALLTKDHAIQSVAQVLLMSGPNLLLIGCLVYMQSVVKHCTSDRIELSLGYSFILLMITCVLGYMSSTYFIFSGFYHRHVHRSRVGAIS